MRLSTVFSHNAPFAPGPRIGFQAAAVTCVRMCAAKRPTRANPPRLFAIRFHRLLRCFSPARLHFLAQPIDARTISAALAPAFTGDKIWLFRRLCASLPFARLKRKTTPPCIGTHTKTHRPSPVPFQNGTVPAPARRPTGRGPSPHQFRKGASLQPRNGDIIPALTNIHPRRIFSCPARAYFVFFLLPLLFYGILR